MHIWCQKSFFLICRDAYRLKMLCKNIFLKLSFFYSIFININVIYAVC